jgi:hypothetical protein
VASSWSACEDERSVTVRFTVGTGAGMAPTRSRVWSAAHARDDLDFGSSLGPGFGLLVLVDPN